MAWQMGKLSKLLNGSQRNLVSNHRAWSMGKKLRGWVYMNTDIEREKIPECPKQISIALKLSREFQSGQQGSSGRLAARRTSRPTSRRAERARARKASRTPRGGPAGCGSRIWRRDAVMISSVMNLMICICLKLLYRVVHMVAEHYFMAYN